MRQYEKLKETVTLGEKVIVSDPCYSVNAWCNITLNDVLPGEYAIEFYKATTCLFIGHAFCLTHSKYKAEVFPKQKHLGTLGIDSGQVGIFPFDDFRNDNSIPENWKNWPLGDDIEKDWYHAVMAFSGFNNKKPYTKMGNCFNSESGYGDGSAELRFDRNSKGQIYRIAVVF